MNDTEKVLAAVTALCVALIGALVPLIAMIMKYRRISIAMGFKNDKETNLFVNDEWRKLYETDRESDKEDRDRIQIRQDRYEAAMEKKVARIDREREACVKELAGLTMKLQFLETELAHMKKWQDEKSD